jgi:hypothetical protein
MTKCEYCGEEIGLLAVRYTWLDKENNRAMHDKCFEEYKKQNEEKIPQKEEQRKFEKEIMGRVNFLTLHGLTDQRYNLIFTEKKLIGQYIGGNTVAFLAGGFLGVAIADSLQQKKSIGLTEETNPEKILSSHKKNFAIDYVDIAEIELQKKNLKIVLNQKHELIGKKLFFIFLRDQHDSIESILMKITSIKMMMKY